MKENDTCRGPGTLTASTPALIGVEGHKEADPLLAEQRDFVMTTPVFLAVSSQQDRLKERCVKIRLAACPRSRGPSGVRPRHLCFYRVRFGMVFPVRERSLKTAAREFGGESGLDGASCSALSLDVQGQVLELLRTGTQPLRERRSEQRGKTVLWGPSKIRVWTPASAARLARPWRRGGTS